MIGASGTYAPSDILADLKGLTFFSALRRDPAVASLERLVRILAERTPADAVRPWRNNENPSDKETCLAAAEAWADLVRCLIPHGAFSSRVAESAIADDNAFTRSAEAAGLSGLPEPFLAAVRTDLSRLSRLAECSIQALGTMVAGMLRSAGFERAAESVAAESQAFAARAADGGADPILPPSGDWAGALENLAGYLRAKGAGDFSRYAAFMWTAPRSGASAAPWGADADQDRAKWRYLRPVLKADPISLADLSGYEAQRSMVVANTLRFVQGKTANNMLLYGDRGTGKSATVKAVSAEYSDRGLRLIEVRKQDLGDFSMILDTLGNRALRFVLFIDDLSFEDTDDSFTDLKALLEGGAETKPPNVVVYATTNRRHLVKERFADRPSTAAAAEAFASGDVRAFDSMQEQFSLADRFGITVVFSAPSQDEYLSIAQFLAERRGLFSSGGESAPQAEKRKLFAENALRWERWFNGRSPRTAQQYVEWVAGGEGFPWE